MFLNAEPHRIGTKSNASVPARMARLISASVTLVTGEVLLHQRVVAAGDRLEHLLAVLVGLVDHVGGDVDLVPLGAELLVVPDEGLHLHQVDEADERLRGFRAARPDRELQDGRGRLEAVLDHSTVR